MTDHRNKAAHFTLSLIETLIEEHPDYSYTSHTDVGGNKYVMLQFPHDDELNYEAHRKFVTMVSELGDNE